VSEKRIRIKFYASNINPSIWDYQKIKVDGYDVVTSLSPGSEVTGSGPLVTVYAVSQGKGYAFGSIPM